MIADAFEFTGVDTTRVSKDTPEHSHLEVKRVVAAGCVLDVVLCLLGDMRNLEVSARVHAENAVLVQNYAHRQKP